jgi:uncharacterized protein DUF4190
VEEQAMTTTSNAHRTASDEAKEASLGTASVVLGVLGFFPVPGVIASALAIALGVVARLSESATPRGRQRATLGICLGTVSLALFTAFCFVYFVVLGYPLPHISRYHPGQ